jgi:hypothetical protein
MYVARKAVDSIPGFGMGDVHRNVLRRKSQTREEHGEEDIAQQAKDTYGDSHLGDRETRSMRLLVVV